MNDREYRGEYLRWLYFQVDGFNPLTEGGAMYFMLLNYLYSQDYYSVIEMDENRKVEGGNLRSMFECDSCAILTDNIPEEEVSVLEVLVAMAMNFRELNNDKEPIALYFWEMISNLGLIDCTDEHWSRSTEEYVERVIDDFLDRDYEPDGTGGLFPLEDPQEDQTEVELWYQLAAYYLENYYEYDSEV